MNTDLAGEWLQPARIQYPHRQGGAAFNPLTHALIGWSIAHIGPSSRRLRFACVAASLLPDLDGLGLLFGKEYYIKYHHLLCHNFAFAFLVMLLSSAWLGFSPPDLLRVFLCGPLHFLGDYWGSGPGWPLFLYQPFDGSAVLNPEAWDFNGPESQIVLTLLLVHAFTVARTLGRTPVEVISPDLDGALVDRFALGFGAECHCGETALHRCRQCLRPICTRHGEFPARYRVVCRVCPLDPVGDGDGGTDG